MNLHPFVFRPKLLWFAFLGFVPSKIFQAISWDHISPFYKQEKGLNSNFVRPLYHIPMVSKLHFPIFHPSIYKPANAIKCLWSRMTSNIRYKVYLGYVSPIARWPRRSRWCAHAALHRAVGGGCAQGGPHGPRCQGGAWWGLVGEDGWCHECHVLVLESISWRRVGECWRFMSKVDCSMLKNERVHQACCEISRHIHD